jgi:hypothetical protein
VDFRIAGGFCRQSYPLTPEGLELRRETRRAIETGNLTSGLIARLPVVENPRLELFRNIDISIEDAMRILGGRLCCVQTTEGCTHQCTHCFQDSDRRVKQMLYVAFLKIAEMIRCVDGLILSNWEEWRQHVLSMGLFDLGDFKLRSFFRNKPDHIMEITNKLRKEWENHGVSRLIHLPAFPDGIMSSDTFMALYTGCVPVSLLSLIHI